MKGSTNTFIFLVYGSFAQVSCEDIEKFHVRYRHLSREWIIFQDGRFPADHSQWNDVENGSGFLGAFREDSATFTINPPEDD